MISQKDEQHQELHKEVKITNQTINTTKNDQITEKELL